MSESPGPVHRLLASYFDEGLGYGFLLSTGFTMNWLEARPTPGVEGGTTMIGTTFEVGLDSVVEVAKGRSEITLQEIHGAGESETYEMLSEGASPGWPNG